jgi:hypothetical protein
MIRSEYPLRRATRLAACVLAATALLSCADTAAPTSHALLHGDLVMSSADIDPGLVAEVHAATSRFHTTVQATKAGYAIGSPCVAHPTLGGMGFHWVNGPLVDPVFNPREPEALVYGPDGKLGAVEYIVINVGQPAPTFAGHPFDVGGTPVPVAHWSLHVWTHRTNPSGIFSPWNPAIVCPT